MRKKVEEIENRISQAEKIVNDRFKAVKKDLSDTEKKIDALNEQIPSITDPEQYMKAIKEKEEAITHLNFLYNNAPKKPDKALSDEEYNAIMNDLQNELSKLEMECAPELLEAVKKAAALMTAYVKQADNITFVMSHADSVHLGYAHRRTNDISKIYVEDKKLMEAFCYSYFMNVNIFAQYGNEENV